jgi:hypothetical protein
MNANAPLSVRSGLGQRERRGVGTERRDVVARGLRRHGGSPASARVHVEALQQVEHERRGHLAVPAGMHGEVDRLRASSSEFTVTTSVWRRGLRFVTSCSTRSRPPARSTRTAGAFGPSPPSDFARSSIAAERQPAAGRLLDRPETELGHQRGGIEVGALGRDQAVVSDFAPPDRR